MTAPDQAEDRSRPRSGRTRRAVGPRPCKFAPTCRDQLPAHVGDGRPEEYHKDNRWRVDDDGTPVLDREHGTKNCQQMATLARKATREAGVAVTLDRVDETFERVQDGLVPVTDGLLALVEEISLVRNGLTARVEQAEHDRAQAEQARETAEAAAREAEQARLDAEAAAEAAAEKARAAEARARQAIADADRRVRDATEQLAAMAEERGEALAAAAYAEELVRRADDRVTAAENEAGRLTGELTTLRNENAKLIRQRDAAQRQALEDSETIGALQATNTGLTERQKADQATISERDREISELKTHWNAAVERADNLATQLTTVHRERADLEQTAARLGAELNAARAAADQERATLTRQADDAERRYTDLVAALAAGRPTAADDAGPAQ